VASAFKPAKTWRPFENRKRTDPERGKAKEKTRTATRIGFRENWRGGGRSGTSHNLRGKSNQGSRFLGH